MKFNGKQIKAGDSLWCEVNGVVRVLKIDLENENVMVRTKNGRTVTYDSSGKAAPYASATLSISRPVKIFIKADDESSQKVKDLAIDLVVAAMEHIGVHVEIQS